MGNRVGAAAAALVALTLPAACSDDTPNESRTSSESSIPGTASSTSISNSGSSSLMLTSTGPVSFPEGSVTVLETHHTTDNTMTRSYAWQGNLDADRGLFTTTLEQELAAGTYDLVVWQFICDVDTPCHNRDGELDRHIHAGVTAAEQGPSCELRAELPPANTVQLIARWDIDGCVNIETS